MLVAVVVFNWLQTQARLHFGKRRALRAFSKPERPEVTIVTTAALPWMTGTAVNALLRAAYLAESGYRVTLCVPWIHPEEQLLVMPKGKLCADPDAQEQLMRTWLSELAGDYRVDLSKLSLTLAYSNAYSNAHPQRALKLDS